MVTSPIPVPPSPAPREEQRAGIVTRANFTVHGSSLYPRTFYAILVKDPDHDGEIEDAKDIVLFNYTDVTQTNGFGTLEVGDRLNVVLTKAGNGQWSVKSAAIAICIEDEKARLSEPRPDSGSPALPPRRTLRVPR